MFKSLGDLAEIMKQVGRLRGEMERIGDELKQLVVEGSAGAGMVKVRMTGKQELIDCTIDPQIFAEHDAELLEDLVTAAVNQALQKSRAAAAEQLGKAAGGLNIPGLPDALGQIAGGNLWS